MANRIVHFEIPATQSEALTKFYGELFGWTFQKASFPGPETGSGIPVRKAPASTVQSCNGSTRGAYAAIIDPQGSICGLWEQASQ